MKKDSDLDNLKWHKVKYIMGIVVEFQQISRSNCILLTGCKHNYGGNNKEMSFKIRSKDKMQVGWGKNLNKT